jgi:crotonobetainyl-CoA:carnitine CoA-transferase CaiB-like acyl-CoA transferase
MEAWGLGPDALLAANPRLVVMRYSGFGQTGPYKDRPGFGTIAECMSGYIGMTGFPDTPPVLPPIPLADEIAGVFGAMAAMMALYHRDAGRDASGAGAPGRGQVIDVSLFEPLFRLCIPHVTMYQQLGIVRERVGNDFPDAAPRSLYRTADDRWLGLSATSQSTFEALVQAMGMPELAQDSRFPNNVARVEHKDALNAILQGWLGQRPLAEIMAQLVPAGGVVGPVYTADEIANDPHYQAREDIVPVDDPDLGQTQVLGVVPKFSQTPGSVEHLGPALGEHNHQVYGGWLGLSEGEVEELGREGVI